VAQTARSDADRFAELVNAGALGDDPERRIDPRRLLMRRLIWESRSPRTPAELLRLLEHDAKQRGEHLPAHFRRILMRWLAEDCQEHVIRKVPGTSGKYAKPGSDWRQP
jgi:hypothetical protein